MKPYTLHYNPQCSDCVKLARWNQRLDWLNRFERTVAPSSLGLPEPGDIHVIDNQTGQVYTGAYATRVVYSQLPASWGLALLLKLPFVFRRLSQRQPGCNGSTCEMETE